MQAKLIHDDLTTRQVYVAADRVSRPHGTAADCPFCPGGLESREVDGPYAFANRWPPVEKGRCEVIVHGGDHERDFARMTVAEVRAVIDLWAQRSTVMQEQPDTVCVLVFENRGTDAGATVTHPHSQVFAFPFVPPLLENPPPGSACPACVEGDPNLRIEEAEGWVATVLAASPAPYCLRLISSHHAPALSSLDETSRNGLAQMLIRGVQRLDALFGRPMPYQLWVPQTEFGHLSVTIGGLLCGPDRLRILGAAELATGLYFSSLSADRVAAALRAALP